MSLVSQVNELWAQSKYKRTTPPKDSSPSYHLKSSTTVAKKVRNPLILKEEASIIGKHNNSPLRARPDYDQLAELIRCSDLIWGAIDYRAKQLMTANMRVRRKIIDDKNPEAEPTYVWDDEHPLVKVLEMPTSSMNQGDLWNATVYHQAAFGTRATLLIREGAFESYVPQPPSALGRHDPRKHPYYTKTTGPITQIVPIHPNLLIPVRDGYLVDLRHFLGRESLGNFVGTPGVTETAVSDYVDNPSAKRNDEIEKKIQHSYVIHINNIITDPDYCSEVGFYGESRVAKLLNLTELDMAMVRQISEYYSNGAVPSMAVILEDDDSNQAISENGILDRLATFRQLWMDRFSSTGKSQKSPVFLAGKIKVQQLQDSLDKTVATELIKHVESRVTAVIGVPSTLFHSGQAHATTAETRRQALREFYDTVVSIDLNRILQKFNQYVMPSYSDYPDAEDYEIVWDLDKCQIAQPDIAERKSSINKLWELGLINRDEARNKLGLPRIGGEMGTQFYRTSVMSDQTTSNFDSNISPTDNKLVAGDRKYEIDSGRTAGRTKPSNLE